MKGINKWEEGRQEAVVFNWLAGFRSATREELAGRWLAPYKEHQPGGLVGIRGNGAFIYRLADRFSVVSSLHVKDCTALVVTVVLCERRIWCLRTRAPPVTCHLCLSSPWAENGSSCIFNGFYKIKRRIIFLWHPKMIWNSNSHIHKVLGFIFIFLTLTQGVRMFFSIDF